MASQIPEPGDSLFKWIQNNPDAPAEVVRFVNKLRRALVKLTAPTSSQTAGVGLVESDQNIIIVIPLGFTAAISDAVTTVGSSVATTSATKTTPSGYTTNGQADAIVTNVNALRVDVLAMKVQINLLLAALRRNGQNPG